MATLTDSEAQFPRPARDLGWDVRDNTCQVCAAVPAEHVPWHAEALGTTALWGEIGWFSPLQRQFWKISLIKLSFLGCRQLR